MVELSSSKTVTPSFKFFTNSEYCPEIEKGLSVGEIPFKYFLHD